MDILTAPPLRSRATASCAEAAHVCQFVLIPA